MSKTFKSEEIVEIPDNVEIKLDGKIIQIKGEKGTITKDFSHAREIEMELDGKILRFYAYFPRKSTIAKLGTLKSVVNNAILGVTKGFTYKMKIAYSHFPITLEPPKPGSNVILIKNFLGERAPRITYTAGPNVKITATKEDVIVFGIDKEVVGQTAANIQRRCRIRQKDKRVFQDGIYVYEKLCGDEVIWKLKL